MDDNSVVPTSRRDVAELAGAILLCQAAGAIGAFASVRSLKRWYPTLRKPSFNPPDAVFGPVWTVLYLLMSVSLYLTRKASRQGRDTNVAQGFFAIQLVLNSAWSLIFFGLRAPRAAFVEILGLWAAIVLTTRAVARMHALAAWLLVPYLLWVSFAAVLNFRIWRLNVGR